MLYLSKGFIMQRSTEKLMLVSHANFQHKLTGDEAALWYNSHFQFRETESWRAMSLLREMHRRGLVEIEEDSNMVSKYRILTRCVPCVNEEKKSTFTLTGREKQMFTWIRDAGLHLSIAELVYLCEQKVEPTPDLLFESNRQALTERIYTRTTILNNVLENQMEHSAAMPQTVKTLLALIKKGRVVLM